MLNVSLGPKVIAELGDTRENPGLVTLMDVMFCTEDEVLYRVIVSVNWSPPLTVTFAL